MVGVDNINDYYDTELKFARLEETGIYRQSIAEGERIRSGKYENYQFVKGDIQDEQLISDLFKHKFDRVIHLAAQAGVRYSIEHPRAYIASNINGFINILEGCRHAQVRHLVYASSSSVYGLNEKMPLSVQDNVDHPISLYAATKKCNELMAHTYSHLYNLPTTGLRFFTVYGPWGRPDMALFLFTKAIIENRALKVFNRGDMVRDFTYIDDIVEGIVQIMKRPPERDSHWNGTSPDPSTSAAPYRIYNIGNHRPVKLTDFIEELEKQLGKKAEKEWLPMQPGDVPVTFADVSGLKRDFRYCPETSIGEGIRKFVEWYREYSGTLL